MEETYVTSNITRLFYIIQGAAQGTEITITKTPEGFILRRQVRESANGGRWEIPPSTPDSSESTVSPWNNINSESCQEGWESDRETIVYRSNGQGTVFTQVSTGPF